jgi:hypothetical protein
VTAAATLMATLALGPAQPAHGARFIAGNDGGILGYFTSDRPKRFIQLDVSGLDNAFEDFAGLDTRPKSGRLWALTYDQPSGDYRVYQAKLDLSVGEQESALQRQPPDRPGKAPRRHRRPGGRDHPRLRAPVLARAGLAPYPRLTRPRR